MDLIQLRDKDASDAAAARRRAGIFRTLADEHGALFILNDRPDLVDAARARTGSTSARTTTRRPPPARVVGPDRIVGRSTHAPDQADAADADPDVDYLAVGPVHETPTKPGRPAADAGYVAYAAAHVRNRGSRSAASSPPRSRRSSRQGARRTIVVRALTERRRSPSAVARGLRAALEEPVGSAARS